jgi:hypothetical protein
MAQEKTVAQHRIAFERFMEANTARLMDFSKPYVGRLCNQDREDLLGHAIEEMWTQRRTHSPKEESLLQFWDRCLRAAALLRATWQVSRFDGWTTVRGEHLGAQGI